MLGFNREMVLLMPWLFAATFLQSQLNNYTKPDSPVDFEKFLMRVDCESRGEKRFSLLTLFFF